MGSPQNPGDGDPWETGGRKPELILGKIAGSPRVGRFNHWIIQQSCIWIDKDNNVFLIKEMSLPYCGNVLRFLARRGLTHGPLIHALAERLKLSGDKLSHLMVEHSRQFRQMERELFEMFEDIPWDHDNFFERDDDDHFICGHDPRCISYSGHLSLSIRERY